MTVLVGLLAFAVNILLLLGTSRVFNISIHPARLVLTGILGGVHAGACMYAGFSFLGAYYWRVVILCAMGLAAFDLKVRPASVYMLLNIAVCEGLSCMYDGKVSQLVFGALAVVILLLAGKWINPDTDRKQRYAIKIPASGGDILITALYDSGNMLIDPLTGKSVLIVSSNVAHQLGIPQTELADPVRTVSRLPGFRLIPYQGIGGGGLLLAKKYDDVSVNGKKGSVLVAFAPNEIGKGYGFQALIGGAA